MRTNVDRVVAAVALFGTITPSSPEVTDYSIRCQPVAELTCEAVLAESAFHLESSGYVLSLVEDEMLRIAFDCNRNIEHLSKIAERYQDRKPDLGRPMLDSDERALSEVCHPHRGRE
jgi:hypothetical protein